LHPLDLIFTDVWGPASVPSTTGAKYYVSFLDDYSKFLWLFPIHLKSDVERIFLNFQTYVEKQFDRKIKAIQSDWGGEYRRLNTYFHQNGINHRLACPHTHQQNSFIERKHRHIVEVGLSLLAHSHLPMIY
jgi:histone deacetylase 1/2